MNELMTKCEELTAAMVADYDKRFDHAQIEFTLEEGRNYIKIVRNDSDGRSRSVAGFVVKKAPKAIDNKTKQPFNVGDMLMAASWNAPATNFARGNVFDFNPNLIRWTGI